MTLTWLLLAAAFGLLGGAGSPRLPRVSALQRGRSLRSLRWLVAAAAGAGCLAGFGAVRGALAAMVAVPVVLVLVTRLHERPAPVRASPALALALDLVAVALRSGQPLTIALSLAAPAADVACAARLEQVSGLLRLGAEPAEAWGVVADDPVLAPVAAAAVRSAATGIRLAAAFEQLADEVRARVRAGAVARAERAGVFAAAPLGLCFLPSFVCLGIVPTIVGIAGGVLATAGR